MFKNHGECARFVRIVASTLVAADRLIVRSSV